MKSRSHLNQKQTWADRKRRFEKPPNVAAGVMSAQKTVPPVSDPQEASEAPTRGEA